MGCGNFEKGLMVNVGQQCQQSLYEWAHKIAAFLFWHVYPPIFKFNTFELIKQYQSKKNRIRKSFALLFYVLGLFWDHLGRGSIIFPLLKVFLGQGNLLKGFLDFFNQLLHELLALEVCERSEGDRFVERTYLTSLC